MQTTTNGVNQKQNMSTVGLRRKLLTPQQYAESHGISPRLVKRCETLGIFKVRRHKNQTYVLDMPLNIDPDEIENIDDHQHANYDSEKIDQLVKRAEMLRYKQDAPIEKKSLFDSIAAFLKINILSRNHAAVVTEVENDQPQTIAEEPDDFVFDEFVLPEETLEDDQLEFDDVCEEELTAEIENNLEISADEQMRNNELAAILHRESLNVDLLAEQGRVQRIWRRASIAALITIFITISTTAYLGYSNVDGRDKLNLTRASLLSTIESNTANKEMLINSQKTAERLIMQLRESEIQISRLTEKLNVSRQEVAALNQQIEISNQKLSDMQVRNANIIDRLNQQIDDLTLQLFESVKK